MILKESEYEREVRIAERRVKSKRQGSRLSLSSTLTVLLWRKMSSRKVEFEQITLFFPYPLLSHTFLHFLFLLFLYFSLLLSTLFLVFFTISIAPMCWSPKRKSSSPYAWLHFIFQLPVIPLVTHPFYFCLFVCLFLQSVLKYEKLSDTFPKNQEDTANKSIACCTDWKCQSV